MISCSKFHNWHKPRLVSNDLKWAFLSIWGSIWPRAGTYGIYKSWGSWWYAQVPKIPTMTQTAVGVTVQILKSGPNLKLPCVLGFPNTPSPTQMDQSWPVKSNFLSNPSQIPHLWHYLCKNQFYQQQQWTQSSFYVLMQVYTPKFLTFTG